MNRLRLERPRKRKRVNANAIRVPRISTVQYDGYFDERIPARYDEAAAEMFDPAVVDPVIDLLVDLAGSGRALELGIGTGRHERQPQARLGLGEAGSLVRIVGRHSAPPGRVVQPPHIGRPCGRR